MRDRLGYIVGVHIGSFVGPDRASDQALVIISSRLGFPAPWALP
jgi:hypothetical protein